MNIYLILVVVFLSKICSGQYLNEIDACIRNATFIYPEYNITERDISNGACGFILQSRGYIVVQPIFMNISQYSRIRLYLISENTNTPSKIKVFEYYNQYLFKNFVYTGYGNHRYALVVLSKNVQGSIGVFKFFYKTNCQMELDAEDFPYFMSPNYMPDNPVLTDYMRYSNVTDSTRCTYTVFSRNRASFTIKITSLSNYWLSLSINNQLVSSLTKITFAGDQRININFETNYYWYYTWYYYNSLSGFTGSVELAYQVLNLLPIDNVPFRGVPQISYKGVNYSIQYDSLSPLDAQVMCQTLGAVSYKWQKPSLNYTDRKLVSPSYQCIGSEKLLLHCLDLEVQKMFYKEFYFAPKYTTLLSCSDKFRLRFAEGNDSSSGVVQVKYGGLWSYICADNMDTSAADVICREMGYKRALSYEYYNGRSSSYNYYNYPYGDYYKYRYGTAMNNIRCNSAKKLKDCYYQISNSYWMYYYSNYYNYNYNYNYNGNNYTFYRPNINNYNNYYCNYGSLLLRCQNLTGFYLDPGHFQGYMMYNDSMVCQDNFAQKNAEVYCRYLGYPGVRKSYSNSSIYTSSYTLVNLQCTGNESSPGECRVNPYQSCASGQALGTICQTIALAGGNTPNEGRIEVYYKGQKGLMCDDSLYINIGNVVCRQLGYSFALNVTQMAGYMYGFGNQNFLLNYISCNGNEDSTDDCPVLRWNLNNCYGNEISGVVCHGNISSTCGEVLTAERNWMSENGYNTTFGANPWQVRIIPNTANEWCSGTIIDRNWVLTSANCFTMSYNNFYITTTSTENNWNSYYWGYTNSIISVYIHPQYSAVTGDYNLALVKVNSIAFSSYVQSACLPSGNLSLSLNGYTCRTTGWNHGLQTWSRPLYGKTVNLYDYYNCRSLTQFDDNKMTRYLCADNKMDSTAIFNGESGGPLICSVNGKNVVTGVVSKSINSARATSIRLFTRVDYLLPWIKSTMA